jgi:hypothetical protein
MFIILLLPQDWNERHFEQLLFVALVPGKKCQEEFTIIQVILNLVAAPNFTLWV